ncbi:MAG: hypothetical protein Q8M88_04555 [Phenylobacterium sp.]|uniref:hypothetical protein n=1 Tax=Phenylobacterium sp. TaxID=1871053 RepID=UPI0027331483|nr:hypothetical protein [Phenylobacterium sp.]MDP3173687.1 hypothetical protein [Phenylobacterium sp.]
MIQHFAQDKIVEAIEELMLLGGSGRRDSAFSRMPQASNDTLAYGTMASVPA